SGSGRKTPRRSRSLTMPMSVRSRTTGRWRMSLPYMSSRASPIVAFRVVVMTSSVMMSSARMVTSGGRGGAGAGPGSGPQEGVALGLHGHDRAVGPARHALGRRPEELVAEPGAAVGADDDEVGAD